MQTLMLTQHIQSKPMKTITQSLVVASLLLSGLSQAEGTPSAKARYQADRAACLQAGPDIDRAACLKEAGAVLKQSRKTGSVSSATPHTAQDLTRNRSLRCQALPVPDREDCVLRMQGEGMVEGSVESGGVMRTLERPVTPSPAQ